MRANKHPLKDFTPPQFFPSSLLRSGSGNVWEHIPSDQNQIPPLAATRIDSILTLWCDSARTPLPSTSHHFLELASLFSIPLPTDEPTPGHQTAGKTIATRLILLPCPCICERAEGVLCPGPDEWLPGAGRNGNERGEASSQRPACRPHLE